MVGIAKTVASGDLILEVEKRLFEVFFVEVSVKLVVQCLEIV